MNTRLAAVTLWIVAGVLGAAESRLVFTEDFTRIVAGGLPEGWKLWSPAPALQLAAAPSPGAGHGYGMAGDGNPNAKSRLVRTVSRLRTGEWYRFEVSYAASNIPNASNSVLAVVQWAGERNMRVLVPEDRAAGVTQAALVMKLPAEAKGAVNLHLFAGFIPNGSVEWRKVEVRHLPGYAPPRRPVRVGVIDSQPSRRGSLEDNARHYASEIERACAGPERPDILVLPENFNRSQVDGESVVALDSEYVRILSAAVRRNRVYLAGSIRAAHDDAVFNTAILLDRNGRLADTYRKTHITVGEMLFSEISRGDEFKVFETDFGKIAILICWDFHFPEAARSVALQGAELVLVPMASDGRLKEDGIHHGAEYAGKAFVLENRIPVAFAATLARSVQPSLIIDQHGAVLARSSDDKHIVQANLDLAAKEFQWSGDDFQAVYTVGRRPELYGAIQTK